jgi:hypothetical protein
MHTTRLSTTLLGLALTGLIASCGHGGDRHSHAEGEEGADHSHEGEEETGDSHEEEEAKQDAGGGHGHDEESLGSIDLGGFSIELAQGHGAVAAGKEGHLVVKLPWTDQGATVVRAWIGTEDRTLSYVGKATYAPDHDDYDVHATAPDPLPDGAAWWVELERPDGTKLVGSIAPIL